MNINKEIYKELKDLKDAFYNVYERYTYNKDFRSVMDSCKYYPFHGSLDETYYDVSNWVEAMRKRMDVLNSWEGIYDKLNELADDYETKMKILDMVRKQLEEDNKYPCMGSDDN